MIFKDRSRHSGRKAIGVGLLAVLATGGIYAALNGDLGDQKTPARNSPLAIPLEMPTKQGQRTSAPLPLAPAPESKPLAPGEPPPTATKPSIVSTPPVNTPTVVEAGTAVMPDLPIKADRLVEKDPTPENNDESTPGIAEIAETTEEPAGRWLEHKIRSGDSLARIFKQLGLPKGLPHRIVRSGKPANGLSRIKPGQMIRVYLDTEGEFAELIHEIDPLRTLHIEAEGDELRSHISERQVEIRRTQTTGIIESSLFASAQKAGLSDALTMELARIFGWDIDFALEIRAGDKYNVVFEERWLDGKRLRDGPILAAEFINQGKAFRAVRFEDNKGHIGYYSPDGLGMQKAFLRTPVKFSRISSRFTKRRWHPVLKKWRSHKGVDYAAPRGTPVKSAGAGTVTHVGRKGGYGKVIFIQHQGKYTTVYGHLSRYAKGLKKGKRVRQGQLIGYVGSTGLASGPHLHYEFRVKGEHRNPLKVTLPPAAPIAKKYLAQFKKTSAPLLAELDGMDSTMVADAR